MLVGTHRTTPLERVIFGRPAAEVVAEEAEVSGARRVFLVTTRSLDRGEGPVPALAAALGSRYVCTFGGIAAHAPYEGILQGARLAREAGADLLVAVGGGSVIDATKLMVLCLWHDAKTVAELSAYRAAPGMALADPDRRTAHGKHVRMLAVPTTLSGAEFTSFAAASDPLHQAKDGYQDTMMAPQAVVLDPRVTLPTPLPLLLSSGVRALDHAIEYLCAGPLYPYFSATRSEAVRLLGRALPGIKREPSNLAVRLEGQLGVWLALVGGASDIGPGQGLGSIPGITFGLSHMIGAVLGARYGVPHGITSCLTLPAVLRWNEPANAERQKDIGPLLGYPEQTAADAISSLIAVLDMPRHCRSVGIDRSDFPGIAELVMQHPAVGTNPRPITGAHDIVELLELAY